MALEAGMDVESLRSLKPELDLVLARYLPHFGREENHRHASVFIQGLLEGGDRRNVENIAERIDGPPVRTLQKFVSQASWRDREMLDELRRHVVADLGDEGSVLNVDETGFPKRGPSRSASSGSIRARWADATTVRSAFS